MAPSNAGERKNQRSLFATYVSEAMLLRIFYPISSKQTA